MMREIWPLQCRPNPQWKGMHCYVRLPKEALRQPERSASRTRNTAPQWLPATCGYSLVLRLPQLAHNLQKAKPSAFTKIAAG